VLKLLGGICHPFWSHKAQGISLRSCTLWIHGLHQKRCNKSNENKESQKQLIEIQKLTSISLKKKSSSHPKIHSYIPKPNPKNQSFSTEAITIKTFSITAKKLVTIILQYCIK
jgi:hypothetical protein